MNVVYIGDGDYAARSGSNSWKSSEEEDFLSPPEIS